ncbi:MAG: DNA repair protein RadA [Candidatus Latescibacteria bacterium]|jgi:DNA repair protein RadA/Sms|nr:DNA repair protein RadA [Candidatus Latescibacterota bacterium]MBT4136506.1 DNA repair protein RadA [Candidatus Latescibacterota bacterium]
MAKMRVSYVCQQCGADSGRWFGRCTGCGAWNTCVEEATESSPAKQKQRAGLIKANPPVPITEVVGGQDERTSTAIAEFDRALGGGIVAGLAALVGGDPGIGKSTLLLQAVSQLALSGLKVLYVSAEESPRQTRMRAQRIGALAEDLLLVSESNLELICGYIEEIQPVAVVIDSIQTIFNPDLQSAPGGVGQVRECAARLVSLAKRTGTAVFLVGHVTKEGTVAGPRVLEHLVDTVLYLEGERHGAFRILRAAKNRFGSTNEIGIFEMRDAGMIEVPNPSQVFLPDRNEGREGAVTICTVEGTRPILVEVQALVAGSNFGYPQRVANGFDSRRMAILVAVLEKRSGLQLGSQDIFLNVAGGLRLDEPAVDLGVALAMVSSFRNKQVPHDTVVFGELGLGGEIRPVGQIERRIAEAHKLGFLRCIVSKANLSGLRAPDGLELIGVQDIDAAQDMAFDTA